MIRRAHVRRQVQESGDRAQRDAEYGKRVATHERPPWTDFETLTFRRNGCVTSTDRPLVRCKATARGARGGRPARGIRACVRTVSSCTTYFLKETSLAKYTALA